MRNAEKAGGGSKNTW